MRGSTWRYVSALLLFGLGVVAVTQAERHVAARPGQVKKGAKADDKDKDKKEESEEEKAFRSVTDDWPFNPPRDRDAGKQLKAVQVYLEFKEVPWPTVCELLQRILDNKSDSFIEVRAGGAGTTSNLVSVRVEANRIIGGFPKAGLEFYQQAYGQDAAKLLADAIQNDYDLSMLADLSLRYFHTKAGAQGTILLGTIHLERGETLEAASCFERLLSRVDADDVLTPRTLYLAAKALKRSGDPRHAVPLRQVMERLNRVILKDNGLAIGRKTLSIEQVQAELDQPVTAIKPTLGLNDWSMRYGNGSRNAISDGGAPFLHALYTIPMLDQKRAASGGNDPSDADALIQSELERIFVAGERRKGVTLPGFFPVTTPDTIIFRSYDGIHAYAIKERQYGDRKKPVPAGGYLWSQSPDFSTYNLLTTGGRGRLAPNTEIKPKVTTWWDAYRLTMNASSILYENPLLGTLAHDGRYVYYIDDIGIPPPPAVQNPNQGFGQVQPAQGGDLGKAINAGTLYAVNMANGNEVWNLGRVLDPRLNSGADGAVAKPALPPLSDEDADQSTDAFRLCADAIFLGPPLPLNGRLYVLIELNGTMRLLCLDPYTLVKPPTAQHPVPALLWSQKLGRAGTGISSEPHRRYQGAFLAAGEGVLVCPTNSGAVIGIDLMSRSLLWARAYRKVEQATTAPRLGQPVALPRLPESRWRSAAPIIANGRIILSAYDSTRLECLDLRSGNPIWEIPRQPDDLYVGGVVNGKVIVVNRARVRAYHLNELTPPVGKATVPSPKLAWESDAIDTPTGHGVIGKGLFFIPVRNENAGQDLTKPIAEIWGINVDSGVVVSKTATRVEGEDQKAMEDLTRYGLGNLVYQDGLVFSQSPWQVSAFPQLDVKKAEMDLLLKANPKDPRGLHERGMIQLDDGKLNEAIADFKEAEKNNPPEELRLKIRNKLYVAYTELLRKDFAAGEQYLGEYEGLCDLPADANEKQNRRRLYRYLLAKGREKQGRLVEAFDQYLELAALGGDRLQPDPDDPSVKVRADVWARGRIEGMVRRTNDPAARQALEDRVNREWAGVKDGNDLNRLRSFVAIFGPYFAVGSEAELKLAEVLLDTNNEADARESQTLLSHIRLSAESPVLRARATETLARLMVRNGQMEDAVALYLQLGKDYPDVVVRDGKTGTDYLTELLTDKRLLPYLEPARYPLPTKVKAESLAPLPQSQMGPVFEIEPEGDLFPAYRRIRFVVDLTGAAGPGWTIRGFDRVTGVERCRFTNLIQPPMQAPGNIPFSKFFKGSGHLVIFQLGTWVYCYDLSEKPPGKERWRRNLLAPDEQTQPTVQNQILQVGADGEVTYRFPDGHYITLGKSAVIQPSYCALVSQDGLEVFDPQNKDRKLWTRRGLPERVQIYGDARHILLVEMGANRQPVSTKLLRAVDGMPVEGATDAARIMAAAGSYRIFGRTVLLNEGGGNAPRVVRMLDLASGKDVWRRQYHPKALFLNSQNAEWTGAINPDGSVEVLSAESGRTLHTLQLGRSYLSDQPLETASEGMLLADRERYFLVLEQTPQGGAARPQQQIYNYSLRTQRVNGPMFCFDRSTGRRLWFVENVLDNQSLILDQFQDLPVIVAAMPTLEPNARFPVYRIVVIQKDEGIVLFNEGVNNSGYVFQNLSVDPRTGTIDFHRFDLRIRIRPDDVKRP